MKGLFNGECSQCEKFKPRCAKVSFKRAVCDQVEWSPLEIVCEDCRKEMKLHLFRLAPEHRSKP